MLLLSLLSLAAQAAAPLLTIPATFTDAHDPSTVVLLEDQWLTVHYTTDAQTTAVFGWKAGTAVQVTYSAEEGAELVEPLTGTRLPILVFAPTFEHPVARLEAACLEQASTTVDMVTCSMDAAKRWSAEIDRTWALLLEKGGPRQDAAIQKARAAWTTLEAAERDTFRTFYDEMDGTIVSLYAAGSHVERLRSQALFLQRFAADVL